MKVAIVVGEASGDLLGARLIRALRQMCPEIEIRAVAGPEMEAAGCTVVSSYEPLAVMGLFEVLRHLPGLFRFRRQLLDEFVGWKPDVFVGIDAPDFTLGLEHRLRAKGIRTVHYVSPSVWAWRQGRVRYIKDGVDRVLTLFPFEARFYEAHGVPVTFVGHTLADEIVFDPPKSSARDVLGVSSEGPVLALLPGSRHGELSRLGPLFFDAVAAWRERCPTLRVIVPVAKPALRQTLRDMLQARDLGDTVMLVEGQSRTAMAAADVVLMSAGTATLEAMLVGRPMVVAYRLSALTYWLLRLTRLIRVHRFALPNLLAQSTIVPEFIQADATPAALAGACEAWLADGPRQASALARFRALGATLAKDASREAAVAVLDVARQGRE